MRTALFLAILVFAGTGGEICITRTMKRVGEVHDFRPRALFAVFRRAFRIGWMWLGILLLAFSFYSLLVLLSWNPVSFVIPASALSYAVGALGAKMFLGEQVSGSRWAGVALVCIGVAVTWLGDHPGQMAAREWFSGIRQIFLLLALGPFVYYLFGILSARSFFLAQRRHSAGAQFTPPASILKPVHGLDRNAYDNFSSFCRQDYPEYEILFAVADAADPAVQVIEQLIRDFPERSIRLLVGVEHLGPSGKVCKLVRLAREARHALLVVSDSDVRVEPDYLRRIAAPFRDRAVGAATMFYRGLPVRECGSVLDCLGASTELAMGVLIARRMSGVKFALGATVATTQERLTEIGGFEVLASHHSDDYELGKRIAERGYRVELAAGSVWMDYPAQTLRGYLRHALRWSIGVRHVRPGGHAGLLFTQGLFWSVAAAVLAPSKAIAAGFLSGYLILRLVSGWVVGVWGLRDPVVRKNLWLLPLYDVVAFVVWIASFLSNHIEWRGLEFTLRDGRLVPVAPRSGRS